MFKKLIFLSAFCILLATLGCASTGPGKKNVVSETSGKKGVSAANPVWPPPPQTPRIRYIESISGPEDMGIKKSFFKSALNAIFGNEEKEDALLRPYGIFAGENRIYVTDPGSGVLHIFDRGENRYFNIKKAKEEEFISPIGVAADKNGDIYMSDSMLKRVLVFNKEGKYLRDIGSPELFARPAGIAVDENRVYVVDTHGHQVLVLAKKDGRPLLVFGSNSRADGDFNFPTNICVGRDGQIYVTDSLNFRVQIFDRNGHFISAFGKLGDSLGDFSKPKGIAVDSEGHIYVADAHFDNIQIFDREGKLLLSFGSSGRRSGEMILPAGIFIDEKDRIYVADSHNKRIQIFQYLREEK